MGREFMVKDDETNAEGTRIDLGDDLIDRTGAISGVTQSQEPVATPVDLEDQLHSAVILMSEGILEDAKKVLRQILIVDPHHVVAREKLDEIHGHELRQIFGEESLRIRRRAESFVAPVDSDAVMRQLDADLQLGIFSDDRGEVAPGGAGLSLFENAAAMADFEVRLDHLLAGSGARDRLDIGIAFLEMGLYSIAVRQFRVVARDAEFVLPANALLAHALILSGRPFDAVLVLEPLLADTDIPRDDKVELAYLMGRANEALQKLQEALRWYSQVLDVDSGYRDVAGRMRLIAERARSPR